MRLFNAILEAALFFIPNVIGWPGVGSHAKTLPLDTKPVPCHSHNDYYRSVPLLAAIQAGCVGVEADIWLFGDDLYVGHTPHSLSKDRTLKGLYLDPLLEILSQQNPVTHLSPTPNDVPRGVFNRDASQTLVLLIDIKAKGPKVWPHLISQLSALRDGGYLTHFNGTDVVTRPVTVVATGKTPFSLVTANETYRDVFFDAPLDHLSQRGDQPQASLWIEPGLSDDDMEWESYAFIDEDAAKSHHPLEARQSSVNRRGKGRPVPYDTTNSYYASVSYRKSIGISWGFRVSKNQLHTIREQIRAAHRLGLKVRYWATPSWPRRLRDRVWTVLAQEGADVLNVDDLRSPTWRHIFQRLGWV